MASTGSTSPLVSRVLSSSALLIGIKLIHRSLGLVSLLLLARLLAPEDFGLIALVSIIVHLFDILANVGSEQYIIQKQRVSTDDLNTAWTIDLLMKSMLWLLLMMLAPFLAQFFEQPALAPALWVGSSILLINAARNPGLFLLQQEFEYRQIFKLSVVQKLLTFIVVIGIAWIERSYWALIAGDIVSSLVFSAGSFLISTHRPRPCVVHWRQQWFFSGWMLLRGVVGYIRSQLDTLFVSKLFPATQLGQYYVARDVAMLPAHNLIMPGAEPLLALFRHSRADPQAMARHLSFSLYIVAVLVVPMAVFIAVFPSSIIRVLLGEQWLEASPVLAAMSLLLLYFAFVAVYEKVLIAHARVRLLFVTDLLGLLIVAGGLLLAMGLSMAEIALVRGGLGVINLVIIAVACGVLLRIRLQGLLGPIACVLGGAVIAALVAMRVAGLPETHNARAMIDLLLTGSVFVGTYCVWLWLSLRLLKCTHHDRMRALIIETFRRRGLESAVGDNSN